MNKGDMVRYSDKYQLAHPNSWRIGCVGTFEGEIKCYPECALVRWENNLASALKSDLVRVTKVDLEKMQQRSLF